MILTCPECSSKYSVKDGTIGPNGRTVRCTNCRATWFVSADPDILSLEDNKRAEAVAMAPPPVRRQKQSAQAADSSPGAHVQMRDKVDRERRNRRLLSVSLIWGVTLGLLALAAVLAYVFRQDVVDQTPDMASLYKLFNIEVKTNGLHLEEPATKSILVDGKPVLVVNGAIINKTNQQRQVPMVALSLKSVGGDVLDTWYVEAPQTVIGPKDRLEYTTQYPNPPVDAVNMFWKFADPSADGVNSPGRLNSPVLVGEET